MSTYQNILQAGKLEGKLEGELKRTRLMVLRGRKHAISAAILADQADMPLQAAKDLLKGYDAVYAFWQKNKGLSTAYLETKYLTDEEVKYLLDLFNK